MLVQFRLGRMKKEKKKGFLTKGNLEEIRSW